MTTGWYRCYSTFSFFSWVLVSIDKIYHTLKTAFDHTSKRLEFWCLASCVQMLLNMVFRFLQTQYFDNDSLVSRIERKYCLISTSYLVRLSGIFILLHIWQNCVRFDAFLPMRTLCDVYSVQSWTYLRF